MVTVAIVGAGQIGSRHLQALALSSRIGRIEVVGRSAHSLKLAKERYYDVSVPGRQSILFTQTLSDVSNIIDVAIIATNADVRYSVINELICTKQVRFLILEKVVFQSVSDFEATLDQLQTRKILAWVNCFRRTLPFYTNLKKLFSNEPGISFKVYGGNWGLGCNAIHYLDLCGFITGESTFEIDLCSELDDRITTSKRVGFLEFTGRVHGTCGANHSFELVSRADSIQAEKICIEGRDLYAEVDEFIGEVKLVAPNAFHKAKIFKIDVPLQSEMTHRIIEDLVECGQSTLSTLAESYMAHVPLLQVFSNHLEKVTGTRFSKCPIT